MKRFIPYIALLALVVVVGCSADSPRARPAPTVVPETWNISSLDASNTGPFVGTVILVEATVTLNGSPAPDDTTITFEASGGAFSNGDTSASVLSEGGTASVAFLADAAGSYVIRARVRSASREIVIEYVDRATTDALQITGVNPRRGSYAGGDQVVITGKGIQAPVEVFFDLDGFPYEAIVVGVTESVPLSADGTITVVTPAFTGTDTGIQQTADVRVNTNAGTGSQETDTLPDAFVLLPGGGPQIFGLSPSSGRSSGGEVVNILGQGFGAVASDLSVSFTDTQGVVKLGTVMAVSPDGTQIQVETPRFSTLPLTADEPQDVTVATIDGVVSLEDAFIVLADEPSPAIASISPIAGPLDGGTLVTIFGRGFQVPLQVTFGNLTALDVNVFNDTTPADNDRITCVTPDYSQQDVVPPVTVDVTVTNVTSGNTDTLPDAFTYGDRLYITGNSPVEGGLGDLVIIYGSGFEDPLQVFLGNDLMELISVSGTELVVRIPDDLATQCTGRSGSFRVVLLESGQQTTGGNFTIVGNTPTVLSVSPVILQETGTTPSGLNPNDITVVGQGFSDEILVSVGTWIAPSGQVDRVSDSTIDITGLPGPDDLGITFDTSICTDTGTGQTGQRQVATAVAVSVTNFPGDCEDTLPGALVIEPFDQSCVVAAGIEVLPPTFPPTESPGPSAPQDLIVTENTGGSDLAISLMSLTGRFFFNAGCTQTTAGPFVVPAGTGSAVAQVYFCPNNDDGASYTGNLNIFSNSPSSPTTLSLNGQEAFPILGVSPGNLSFTSSPETQQFTISNTGTGDLDSTGMRSLPGQVLPLPL
jgi:hypothetical protein